MGSAVQNPPPASGIGGSTGATDNALLRADGTGGATAQSSSVSVSDAGTVTIPAGQTLNVAASGTMTYTSEVGPSFFDSNLGQRLTFNVQGITAATERTWNVPDVTGTPVIASAVGTTVGAAGGASALPATPLGYMTVTLPSGTAVVMPYYTAP